MPGVFWWLQFFHILNPVIPTDAGFRTCKALPNTSSWPSDAAWTKLNDSILGNLLKPLPPGSVCDQDLLNYNNATCAKVFSEYGKSMFHANDPVSVDWPNMEYDGCLPTQLVPCNLEQFPLYVVNASKPHHVKAGVDFARSHNVRLIVKGTGHDFLGRSTAPHSMSIWTRHLKGLNFQSTFTPQSCKKQYQDAITIAAGHQMKDIYAAVAKHDRLIVGGMDPNVGIGGYITAGGHSPFSTAYGLGSDHALEFEVVTPDGAIVTANECSNTDLFWAMKGGGGSTFGVLLSVTLGTIPMPSVAVSTFSVNSTAPSNDDFWSAVAYLHTQLPDLSDAGLMGYSFLFPNPLAKHSGGLGFAWLFWMVNKNASDVNAVMDPLMAKLKSSEYSKGIAVGGFTTPGANAYDWWTVTAQPSAVGTNSRLGSRLLDRKALTQDVDIVKERLQAAYPGVSLLGHLIAGKGVADVKPPGGPGAVLPAWRTAYYHLVIPVSWPYYNATGRALTEYALTHKFTQALRDWAPDTGCYLNEADIYEPDLGHAFWGDNYKRLLKLKRKMDPKGVFWCGPCVGGRDWSLNAKQQLCRV